MDKEKEITEAVTDQRTSEENTIGVKEDSIRRDYGFASDVELKECRYCRVMIPKKAKVCPNCRMSLKRHWFRNLVAAVFAVAVIGVGGYYLSEHWGIMQDAVRSVWMAQDSSAVPAVSVAAVDTVEVTDGVLSTWTSPVAANTESSENAAEEATKSGMATVNDNTAETAKNADSAEAAVGTSEQAQNKGADDKQPDPDKASSKEDTAADTDKLTEDKAEKGEDAEDKDAVSASGTAAGKTNTDVSEQEEDENAESSDENGSAQDKSDEKSTVGNNSNAVNSKDNNSQAEKFRDDCIEVSYKALLRDSETYLNTALKVEVQVVCQVTGGLFDENIYYLCKVEEVSGIERYYIIRDDREEDDILILEGDTLTVYGELFGNCKLPASLIETRPTVPAVSMLYLDLIEE